MPKCPMSEIALQNLHILSETYKDIIHAGLDLEKSELAPAYQKRRAFRRAEKIGLALDALLDNWASNECPATQYSCCWEDCRRRLQILDSLTPCNKFYYPLNLQNLVNNPDAEGQNTND